jgi:hypothetical protein
VVANATTWTTGPVAQGATLDLASVTFTLPTARSLFIENSLFANNTGELTSNLDCFNRLDAATTRTGQYAYLTPGRTVWTSLSFPNFLSNVAAGTHTITLTCTANGGVAAPGATAFNTGGPILLTVRST